MSSDAFTKAANEVRQLKSSPTDEEKLNVYALFKQAKEGDCNIDRPGGLMNFEAKAKWDAWNGKKGMAKDAAEAEYVTIVEELKTKYGMKE